MQAALQSVPMSEDISDLLILESQLEHVLSTRQIVTAPSFVVTLFGRTTKSRTRTITEKEHDGFTAQLRAVRAALSAYE